MKKLIKKKNKVKKIKRVWRLIDADGKVLGRLATEIALFLRGKNKVDFTPNVDGGDYVVVINTNKIQVSGRKNKQKIYWHHTGYPGGIKSISYEKLFKKDSTKVLAKAVFGMLPKNKLRAEMMKRLRMFKGSEHTYKNKLKSQK